MTLSPRSDAFTNDAAAANPGGRLHFSSASARSTPAAADATRAVAAGFLGWTLDAFDYFLVVVSLPLIQKSFGASDTKMAWTVTATLMARPLGAFIFGLLADRFGRRLPMIIDILFYSAIEVATGFAHTFTQFIVLRALFGIGMGGEWGVGASLAMEKVSPRLRGVISGFLQEGYAVGFLLAALVGHFMLNEANPDSWRPLFFIGGLPALLALFIRFGISESEVWEKNKAESWKHLGTALASHWPLWIYLTLLMACMNLSSHGTQDLFPKFMKGTRGLSTGTYTDVVMISMAGAIIGGIGFGLASDRIGRRIAMVIAFVGALAAIPLWAFSTTLTMIVLGAFLMQFFVQGAWGIIPAHINELSPNNVRGFLPGFSYQCGNFIASYVTVIQAWMATRNEAGGGLGWGYAKTLAITAAVIFVLAMIATLAGQERRGAAFDQDGS